MTENNNDRFIIPDGDIDCDVTLIDTATGEEYTDNFEDVVVKMNKLDNELLDSRAELIKLKLIIDDVVEDLEKQATSGVPVIISGKYVEWIKKECGLDGEAQ